MNAVLRLTRRIINRIVNSPSRIQKRRYLELLNVLEPLRRPILPPENPESSEKPVLIISGITMQGTGIFCNLLAFLRWVHFAERMNYTPVIDMQNVPNLYLEDELLGKENSYEYFYRQPGGISLEQAYQAKTIYFVNRLDCPYSFSHKQKRVYREVTAIKDWIYGENREKHFALYKRLYDTYFVPSDEAQAFVNAQWNTLIAPGERVLGLLCRGSDYFTTRPIRHQIQPTPQQIIEKVEAFLSEHTVDKIFVATEDTDILHQLQKRFKNLIVFIDCPRVEAKAGRSVAEGFREMKVNRKMNGLYYYASIACLAKCNHLIAGKTMATQFIRTIKDSDFETEFYWNLGRYGVDDR